MESFSQYCAIHLLQQVKQWNGHFHKGSGSVSICRFSMVVLSTFMQQKYILCFALEFLRVTVKSHWFTLYQ